MQTCLSAAFRGGFLKVKMNATQNLDQVEAILHSLTGSAATDELRPEQVQSLLVLCTGLVQDARATFVPT